MAATEATESKAIIVRNLNPGTIAATLKDYFETHKKRPNALMNRVYLWTTAKSVLEMQLLYLSKSPIRSIMMYLFINLLKSL